MFIIFLDNLAVKKNVELNEIHIKIINKIIPIDRYWYAQSNNGLWIWKL
jgi:hypothetical protein